MSQSPSITLSYLQDLQLSRPLSILILADPITSAVQSPSSTAQLRQSDASGSNSELDSLTPASLATDLTHYKDLFSKLRFSYLEQVTKEKFLRSIVGDPPLLVNHAENVALETQLVSTKAQLKAKKEEVAKLVEEMEEMARDLAGRWEGVQSQMQALETLPTEIVNLEVLINTLNAEIVQKEGSSEVQGSALPRLNLSLEETTRLVTEQHERSKQLDKEIAALQRQMPAKTRDCEAMERELEQLERKRHDATSAAKEAKKIRDEGGRDELEERGRWYKSSETVLSGIVRVEG